MNYEQLGIDIALYRRKQKVSQAELAERANISRNYLSMIELGKAQALSVEVLVSLARAMRKDPAYLLCVLLEVPERQAVVPRTRWA